MDTMKTLSVMLFLLLLLGLPALSEPPSGPPVTERWEIVTDLYIGVQTEQLTEEERAAYGELLFFSRSGLRIKKVEAGSPAEQAGLLAGDILLCNCGCRINSMEDLLMSLRNHRPGELTHFIILRGEKSMPVVLRLGRLPEPVVVAYATPGERDTYGGDDALNFHRRVACLLVEEVPDLDAVRAEVKEFCAEHPNIKLNGQLRLYYTTPTGYFTITVCYGAGASVSLPNRDGSSVTYELLYQGDTLPEHVRKILAPHGYPKKK